MAVGYSAAAGIVERGRRWVDMVELAWSLVEFGIDLDVRQRCKRLLPVSCPSWPVPPWQRTTVVAPLWI
jgi:hypothetical protein